MIKKLIEEYIEDSRSERIVHITFLGIPIYNCREISINNNVEQITKVRGFSNETKD